MTVSVRGAGADYFATLAGQIYAGTNIIDNTQIYTAMMNAAQNAGAEHIVLMIGDGMNVSHEIAASRYLYSEDFGLSRDDWGTLEDGWMGYATTWDVTSYNNFVELNGVAKYAPEPYDPVIGYDPEQGGETPYPVAMTFSGTPDHEDVGELDILVTVTDKNGASTSQAFEPTVEEDTVAPTVESCMPANGATEADVNDDIALEFSEDIVLGDTSGVVLHEGSVDGGAVEASVSATRSTLMVDPTGALLNGTEYYLTFADGSVVDLAGNAYDDESDVFHFTTLDAAVAATGGSSDDGLSTGEVLAGAAGLGLLAYLIL